MSRRSERREARAQFDDLLGRYKTYDERGTDGAIELLNELEPLLDWLSAEQRPKADLLIERCKWIGLHELFAATETRET